MSGTREDTHTHTHAVVPGFRQVGLGFAVLCNLEPGLPLDRAQGSHRTQVGFDVQTDLSIECDCPVFSGV